MGAEWSLAWRNVARHRLRSALTGTAISLGVGTVVAAVTVAMAAQRQATELSSQGGMSNTVLVEAALAMAGLLLLVAAGFIILNAFGMSLAQRQRELGMLRAVGMTRRQVRSAVLAEATVLGVIGSAGGLPLGVAMGWGAMRAAGALNEAVFRVPWWGLVGGPAVGLAVALAGALQPAWQAGRVAPMVAIREGAYGGQSESPSKGFRAARWGPGLLVLTIAASAGVGLIGRPNVVGAVGAVLLAQVGLLAGTVLTVPGLVAPLARWAEPILARRLGAAGQMAAGNLGRPATRLRATLTAGAMAAGLAALVLTGGLMTAGLKGGLLRFGAMLHEDTFVVTDIVQLIDSGQLTASNFYQFISSGDPRYDLYAALDRLEPLVTSGVIVVERYRFVPVPPQIAVLPGSPAIAVDPGPFLDIGNFDFYEGDAMSARTWLENGRALLLQPMVAERLGVHPGDRLVMRTAVGPVEFTVAGVGGSGWNMTVVTFDDAAAYLAPGGPTHLGIIVPERGEANVAAALAQVRQAIAPLPGLTLNEYENYFGPLVRLVDRLQALVQGLLLLAVVVAAMGVVNSVAANAAERRREFGLLRAVGATQGQVRRTMVAEAGLLGLLAAGVAAGLGLLMLLTWLLLLLPNGTASVGVRPDWDTIKHVALAGLRDLGLAAAAALVAGPLVAALAAYWPARAAAAVSIVDATRSE